MWDLRRVGYTTLFPLLMLPALAIAHGGDATLVHSCVRATGALRIVGPNVACARNETPLDWPGVARVVALASAIGTLQSQVSTVQSQNVAQDAAILALQS